MSQEKPSLTAAIRHLAERERSTEHATPRELTAYHEGSLPPEAEARVRQHLALCRHCSDLLLDLAGFATLTPPPGIPELTDAEVEEDWQKVKAKLGAGLKGKEGDEVPQKTGVVVPIRPRTQAPGETKAPSRRVPVWAQAAAALVIAAVGFFAGSNRAPDEGPTAGPVHILEAPIVRGGGANEVPIVYTRLGLSCALRFHPDAIYEQYEATLLREDREVWEYPFDRSKVESDGAVAILVPDKLLKPGRYTAVLYGRNNGEGTEIERFDIQVDAN